MILAKQRLSNAKKKVLREYKKVLATEEAVQPPVTSTANGDDSTDAGTINSQPKKSLQQLYEEKQEEFRKQKEEARRAREEQQQRAKEKKEQRKQQTLKMLQRTKRGQPVLKSHIEKMLGKLQRENLPDPHAGNDSD